MTDDEVIAVAKMFGANLEQHGKHWRWVHADGKHSDYTVRSVAINMARQYFTKLEKQHD